MRTKVLPRLWGGAVLLAALSSDQVGAAEFDGNALLLQCQEAVNAVDTKQGVNTIGVGLCLGLVAGVRDTMHAYNKLSTGVPEMLQACFPDKVTNEQSAQIVVNYLQDYPEKLDQSYLPLVVAALADAYPCE